MFTKTSSFFYQKYGDTYLYVPKDAQNYIQHNLTFTNSKFNYAFYCNEDIYIHVNEGICIICISETNNSETFEKFVIHHTIRLKKNQFYNFLSISEQSDIMVYIPNDAVISCQPLAGFEISINRILPKITIDEILVYYYQVKNSNYVFEGEEHNYWELTYVDSGHLITEVNGKEYHLKQHDIILYAPGQFHSQKTDGVDPCSYLTVIFKMNRHILHQLCNQVFHSNRNTINCLQSFINTTGIYDVYNNDLCICYLNQAIIQILQSNYIKSTKVSNSPIQQKFEDKLLNDIIMYINCNFHLPITVEQLCHQFSISRSSLQQLFNNNLKSTPKHYITEVKLKHAKLMIKENKYTISEISEKLGFASIHYFSRKFKKEFNLAPSEYAKTIYKT